MMRCMMRMREYGITDSMDMSLNKLREIVKDRKPGMMQSVGRKESDRT